MAALRLFLLLGAVWAQTAFQADPFQPLEDYAPPPSEGRTRLGLPSPSYWQQRADYEMQISLDPTTHRLRGEARLTYTNNAPISLCRLWLAIEPNYFSLQSYGHLSRNFQWEDFRRDAKRGQGTFAELYARQIQNYLRTNFQLEALSLSEGLQLTPLAYRLEETLLEVTLPKCLNTGERIVLYLKWQFTLNDGLIEGRAGYMETEEGPIYQVAQYYPRPVAFTDARGWEKMPYYGPSEFAVEFGDYRVQIRVPKGYTVAATGELQNPTQVLTPTQLQRYQSVSADKSSFIIAPDDKLPEVGKDTVTWVFQAQQVRDFAWAAARQYLWEARLTNIEGRSTPVRVQAFYTAAMAPLWKHLAIAAAEHTLQSYSRYTFSFPYPTMNVTYGPVYGMEYPMIVFCGRQELKKDRYTEAARHGFISLVIHEVGHNFFPMIVNSDERRWMWLDEGLNTYLENLSKATFEPMMREREAPAERSRVRQYLASGNSQPILAHPHTIREMGANAYLKVAVGLEALREYILDPARMDTAFRRYAEAWAFRRPEPWDLFRVVSNSTTQELGWFWKGWFLETKPADLAIDTVVSRARTLPPEVMKTLLEETRQAGQAYIAYLSGCAETKSFFIDRRAEIADDYTRKNRSAYEDYLRRYREEKAEAETRLKAHLEKPEPKALYETRLFFRNIGGLVWPLWVKVVTEDGALFLWRFPAESWAKDPERLVKVIYTVTPVREVVLDPWSLSPDINPQNHAYTLPRSASRAAE
jgi:hypothetical protein